MREIVVLGLQFWRNNTYCGYSSQKESLPRGFLGAFIIIFHYMEDKSNLYVSNFSWDKNEEDLKNLFTSYGEIESAKLIMDRETGRSRWFGFVKFANEADADRAMNELNGFEVDGRQIRVTIAQPRPERPQRY
mgnify:CR=1 FL=1